jgi:hypothetical protein
VCSSDLDEVFELFEFDEVFEFELLKVKSEVFTVELELFGVFELFKVEHKLAVFELFFVLFDNVRSLFKFKLVDVFLLSVIFDKQDKSENVLNSSVLILI